MNVGKPWVLSTLALASSMSILTAPAFACRLPSQQRSVVLVDPPSGLPEGAALMRVRLLDTSEEKLWKTGVVRATVLAGGSLTGSIIEIRPGVLTSCDSLGVSEGYLVGYVDRSSTPAAVDPVLYRRRGSRTDDEEWSRGYKRSAIVR